MAHAKGVHGGGAAHALLVVCRFQLAQPLCRLLLQSGLRNSQSSDDTICHCRTASFTRRFVTHRTHG